MLISNILLTLQEKEYFQFSVQHHNIYIYFFTVVPCILILSRFLFTNWCTRELL